VPFSKTECEELSRMVEQLACKSCSSSFYTRIYRYNTLSAPRNENSVAKTVFLAWLMREVCSYRDAYGWGHHTQKELQFVKQERRNSGNASYNPSLPIAMATSFVINILFFGIPHTYRGHIKVRHNYDVLPFEC
jgi:hypothetical protein